jgi:hypothetical protein
MKKNKLLILLSFATVGCSGSKQQPTLLSQLQVDSQEEKIITRGLANTQASCLKDTFNVTTLRAEMKELEKKFSSAPKVKGQWQHLDLSKLSVPQANFLKSYGKNLGDANDASAFDFSACEDVPCIINKLYGKDDYVAGYVHYNWYLRFGHYLAAVNKVYDAKSQTKPGVYNEKIFPLSAYLYREKELYAWWRLSLMIKAPYTDLKDLKEIYRVPQGESFDMVVAERKRIKEENIRRKAEGLRELPVPWGETCGLAYSNGYVIMQDLCLTLYGDNESGNFYDSVLHELTHQLDYHEGRKLRKAYRSQEKDYLDVSHFFLDEYKDEQGKTVRQWEHKPGIRLVTTYAGTSPAENFAETIANYRVSGTETKKKITENHWNWVSNTYYPKKSFDQKSLIDEWLVLHNASISQASFNAVADCSKAKTLMASTYFAKADFVVPLAPATLNCLGVKAVEISKELQGKIKISSPDGCSTLTEYNTRTAWEPAYKTQVKLSIEKYLKELQTDKDYFERIQDFHKQIPDKTMAIRAYLECYGEQDDAICYKDTVIGLALEKISPLNLPEPNANELAELYWTSHALSDIKTHLLSYYRSFVQSNKAITDEVAQDIFAACEAVGGDDQAPPTGKYFTLSDGYLVSSIYNCLNVQFPDAVKSIVRDLSVNGLKVQHSKEELILSDEVLPELQKSLLAIYSRNRAKEFKAATEFSGADSGSLRKAVMSDFSWSKDIMNSSAIQRDCQAFAYSKIQFKLLYHLPKDLFSSVVSEACYNIDSTPEFTTFVETSKSQFADTSIKGLEAKVLELARARANVCLGQYPVDTNLNRIKFKTERENCLLGHWEAIEKEAVKVFETDPVVIRLKIDTRAVVSQLEVNRRRHQLRVIKENF